MLDDFFIRALLAASAVAVLAGPFGCMIVWRRLAYFGDSLGHAALFGVAIAIAFQFHPTLGVLAVAVAFSGTLYAFRRRQPLPTDSLLGLLSHTVLAAALLLLDRMPTTSLDLYGLLFGDVLAASYGDLVTIFLGGATMAVILAAIWRALFAATVNAELARAEGHGATRAELVFLLLLAVFVALAMKIVGVLLVTALMIVPATTARLLMSSALAMVATSVVLGLFSVFGGLFASLAWDMPSGPAIVAASGVLFLTALALRCLSRRNVTS